MKLIIFLNIVAVIIGSLSCEKTDLDSNLKIFDSINSVTKDLVSIDGAKKAFRDKCANISGSDEAFTRAVNAADTLRDCVTNLIDVEQLQNDIRAATPKGELDTVFNKYCRNRTIATECLNNFGTAVEPCLDSTERDFERIFTSIVTKLLDFICFRDGDMIALFIAENGPKCINDNKDELIACINSTFHKYMPDDLDAETVTLPNLEIGQEQCNDMDALQQCVVTQLEKCEDSTPANFVESMFKFVRKETVCKKK